MPNWFAKLMLVATSLSPILGAVAIREFSHGKSWTSWGLWLGVAMLLIVICWGLLKYVAKSGQTHIVHIKEFERKDGEVLAFLLAYLLPFVTDKDKAFTDEWLTGAYVLAILALSIAHAGAFHFNPVMGLLGYHFYAVKNGDGAPILVISEKELCRIGIEINTVRIDHNIYMSIGEADA